MSTRKSRIKKRNLRPAATAAAMPRAAVDGRAPRYGPGEFIGGDVRGVGAFEGRDPMRTGKVFNVWQWLAMAGWAGMLAGALSAARRRLKGS